MTASKEVIIPLLKEFPKYVIVEEIKKEAEEKVKVISVEEKEVDPVQKKRNERKWKESEGYYLLNPKRNVFGFKDL